MSDLIRTPSLRGALPKSVGAVVLDVDLQDIVETQEVRGGPPPTKVLAVVPTLRRIQCKIRVAYPDGTMHTFDFECLPGEIRFGTMGDEERAILRSIKEDITERFDIQ